MSAFQNPQLFPYQSSSAFNHKVVHVFANILRSNFKEEFSAIKEIHLKTGIDPRSIENWYQARNAPSSRHLIMLAHHIPDVIEAFLNLAGKEEIWIGYRANSSCPNGCKSLPLNSAPKDFYGDKNVSVNVSVNSIDARQLNERQLWFLEKLQQQCPLNANDIINQWGVTDRTARRDISSMIALKIIHFVGADKTGRYEVLPV